MRYQPLFRWFLLLFLISALLMAGCSALVAVNQPAAQPAVPATQAPAPTLIESAQTGGVGDINVLTDEDKFITALLQALMSQDVETLQRGMSTLFLTGAWRADGSDSAPADALKMLYSDYLGTDNRLEVVKGADLKALMGGQDPLSYPRAEAGVIDAVLVSGWGKDGRDEAILFIAREADNRLKWQGWMVIQGGFSGARLGGIQPYANQAYGYSVFLPKGYEVQETNPGSVLVMAPGAGHPGETRAAAFIDVAPANGRTVEEIVDKVKADLGPGFNIPMGTMLGLDKAPAIILSGLPGQDVNRQLFAVYNDRLYHITFVPDTPKAGTSYWQMEDVYAMIINTFHFTY